MESTASRGLPKRYASPGNCTPYMYYPPGCRYLPRTLQPIQALSILVTASASPALRIVPSSRSLIQGFRFCSSSISRGTFIAAEALHRESCSPAGIRRSLFFRRRDILLHKGKGIMGLPGAPALAAAKRKRAALRGGRPGMTSKAGSSPLQTASEVPETGERGIPLQKNSLAGNLAAFPAISCKREPLRGSGCSLQIPAAGNHISEGFTFPPEPLIRHLQTHASSSNPGRGERRASPLNLPGRVVPLPCPCFSRISSILFPPLFRFQRPICSKAFIFLFLFHHKSL